MNETKVLPFMSGWSQDEQLFAHICIEIIVGKYEKYKGEHRNLGYKHVPLEKIKIELSFFQHEHPKSMPEHIVKLSTPGKTHEQQAKELLSKLDLKEELKSCGKGVYQLTKTGYLYKHLSGVIQ